MAQPENQGGAVPPPLVRFAVAASVTAVMVSLVIVAAFLEALLFDPLPRYLDAGMAVGTPFLWTLVFVSLIARGERSDTAVGRLFTRHVPAREISVACILPATLAAVYPGMFPARDLLHLVLAPPPVSGAPADAAAHPDVSYFRFPSARLKQDLSGVERVIAPRSKNTNSGGYVDYRVTPIVGPEWTPERPVTVWAADIKEPWPGKIEGAREYDARGHYARAVQKAVERHGLNADDPPVLVSLADGFDDLVASKVRWTLVPLGGLSFVTAFFVFWSAWAGLSRPLRPRKRSPP